MKKKLFLMGMAALLCALGLVLVGCDNGNGGDSDGTKTQAEKNEQALKDAGEIELIVEDADGNSIPVVIEIDGSKVTITIDDVETEYDYTITDSALILKGAGAEDSDVSLGYTINSDGTLTITGGLNEIDGAELPAGEVTSAPNDKLKPPATGGGGNEWGGDDRLVGVWKNTNNEVLTFTSTTVKIESHFPTINENYTAKNGKLTIQNTKYEDLPYSIAGNVLTVDIFSRGEPGTAFTKQTTGGGGNTDPKVFVITGIDDTLYGYIHDGSTTYAAVKILPSGSEVLDGYRGTGLVARAETDSRDADPDRITVDATSGNHMLTANLYAAPALTAAWTGAGTYDVYLAIGLGLSNHVYRCVNVTISSVTTTKTAADFTDVTR